MADVSVIIFCYNRWPKIREAVDSVLMQGNALPIVVDDASTDGSAEKLREAYGDKIQLLVQDVNQEKSAARNKGIHAADSEFICFLDSDDVLLEDSVKNRQLDDWKDHWCSYQRQWLFTKGLSS